MALTRIEILVLIALILVLTPTAILAYRRFRENGLEFNISKIWMLQSFLGLALLAVFVFLIVSPLALSFFDPGFFPSRAYLLFLISGVAFAVVIFPGQAIEISGIPPKLMEMPFQWIFVLPAWLWIVVLFVLVTEYPM